MSKIIIFETSADLAEALANQVIESLHAVLHEKDAATWVLAGGTTPSLAYQIIADKYADTLRWDKINFVLGDERFVEPSSLDSNWSQVEKDFLGLVAPEASTQRPVMTESVEFAALNYETYLKTLPTNDSGIPILDHAWLGMGEDGHTLSLFPGQETLDTSDLLVTPVRNSPKPPAERISLTFKTLSGIQECFVIVAGSTKADVVARAIKGDETLPITRVVRHIEASGGKVTWMLDRAAAQNTQA